MTLRLRHTGDLPPDMQFDDSAAAHAVRTSGLRISTDLCRHRDEACPRCVVEAARRIVEAADRVVARADTP